MMLRAEIVNGVENINRVFVESRLIESVSATMDVFMGRSKEQNSPDAFTSLLSSFYAYDKEADKFSQAERSIIEICGFSLLSDIAWRSQIMTTLLKSEKDNFSQMHSLVGPMLLSFRNFKDVFPKIANLLEVHNSFDEEFHIQNIGKIEENIETLSLILSERDGHPSSSKRVSRAIEAISTFYEAVATIRNEHSHRVYIVSCDSGSNKVFDFRGSGEILKGVKDIILSIWDKAITHRRDSFAARLEIVKSTLPIINTVADMQRAGTMSDQEAHRLTKMLVNSAVGFMETGSTIPELKDTSYFEPQKLISLQEPLLLSSPSTTRENTPAKKATPRTRSKPPATIAPIEKKASKRSRNI